MCWIGCPVAQRDEGQFDDRAQDHERDEDAIFTQVQEFFPGNRQDAP